MQSFPSGGSPQAGGRYVFVWEPGGRSRMVPARGFRGGHPQAWKPGAPYLPSQAFSVAGPFGALLVGLAVARRSPSGIAGRANSATRLFHWLCSGMAMGGGMLRFQPCGLTMLRRIPRFVACVAAVPTGGRYSAYSLIQQSHSYPRHQKPPNHRRPG